MICEEIICNNTNDKCQNGIFECNDKYKDCSFICMEAYYQCANSTFICPQTAKSCVIKCLYDYSCYSTNIICSRDTQCNITSNSKYSLTNTKINGPYQQQTTIKCDSFNSCNNIWIDTKHSINLHLSCNEINSCQQITIYCPIGDSDNNCNINTERYTEIQELNIYAINSWNDLNIEYSLKLKIDDNSRMFCGDKYEYSCLIGNDTIQNEWNCIDKTSQCYVQYDRNNNNGKQFLSDMFNVSIDGFMTILFVVTFTIILILSCRFGHQSNSNKGVTNLG